MNLKVKKVNTGLVYSDRGLCRENDGSGFYPQNNKGSDVSFKGSDLFSKLTRDTVSFSDYGARKLKLDEIFGGEFSKMESDLLDTYRKLNAKSRLIVDDAGKVTFVDDGILPKLFKSATYPFKDLWLDLSSWILRGAAKAKSLPSLSNFAQNALNSPVLQKRADVKKAEELFCILQGTMSDIAKDDRALSKLKTAGLETAASALGAKMPADTPENVLNNIIHATSSVKGNYKTADERTVNRICTGLVSSTMAGIDFYNISRMQNDNDTLARKSQKKRFKQESSRILMSAAMTFLSLGALSKYVNSNKYVALVTISGTALVSEILSRLLNHMPLHPLTPEEARDYAYHKPKNKDKDKKNDAPAQNKNAAGENILGSMPSVFGAFSAKPKENSKGVGFGAAEHEDKNGETQSALNLKNVLKVAGVLFGTSLGVYFLRGQNKNFDSFLECIKEGLNDAYGMITKKDFEVEYDKITKILDKIDNEYNMHQYAQKFRDALSDSEKYTRKIKNIDGKEVEFVKLGQVDKKIAAPVFRTLTYPFVFVSNAINFPVRILKGVLGKQQNKVSPNVTPEDLTSLYKVFDKAYKKVESGKMTNAELEEFIKRKVIMGAENKTGKSTYKNSSLAAISRPLVTLIASYFFVNDYRNEVLITSHGEDIEGANTVAKERVMHKVSNFFFNSLLMNLFNTVFEKAYHGSLLGAGLVAAATEFTNENLIRKSIGVPTRKLTRDEIIEHDRHNLERNDFWGKYFRLMSKLTGKKTISQKVLDEEKKKQQKSAKA